MSDLLNYLKASLGSKYDPDLDWLNKLATVLELHVADLFEEPGSKSELS